MSTDLDLTEVRESLRFGPADEQTVLALLGRLEAAEATIARVRALCMDTDGNYLDPEDECNNVGGILQALGGE